MAKQKNDKTNTEIEKLTFRIWPPYTARVAEMAKLAGLTPNQFGRLATMVLADSGLLGLDQGMRRMEAELLRLRRDFNAAIE